MMKKLRGPSETKVTQGFDPEVEKIVDEILADSKVPVSQDQLTEEQAQVQFAKDALDLLRQRKK